MNPVVSNVKNALRQPFGRRGVAQTPRQFLAQTAALVGGSVLRYFLVKLLIGSGALSYSYDGVFKLICINVILALSANLIINFTGQLTLGHSAFMAFGAYTAAELAVKLNVPIVVGMVAGGVVAAFFGFLIGLPTLRLKGDYLAIATLGFCQIVANVLKTLPWFGGAGGIRAIPLLPEFAWYFFTMVACALVMFLITRSRHGRAMVAVREDEVAAEAMGVNTTRYKILAFTAGAFFAGIAGGLFAGKLMFIEPKSFNFMLSINIIIYVILGGAGSFTGCIFVTALLTLLDQLWLISLQEWGKVVYPALLILFMLLRAKNIRLSTVRAKVAGLFHKKTAKPAEGGDL